MHRELLVLVLAVVIQLALAELSLEEIKKANEILRKHCQPESGVSDDILNGAMSGNFPEDRGLKCYLACMMRLAHVLKNGQYRSELAVRLADDVLPSSIKDRARVVVEKCKDEGAGLADECEMAFAIKKCSYAADPEIFYVQ
uniref:Chemosensory protein n=1 Tax=Blattella germanica TaxID=6973 RepID=A0A0X9ZUN1_BLAGE|nr:chemosensory protein [Blattella germanica]